MSIDEERENIVKNKRKCISFMFALTLVTTMLFLVACNHNASESEAKILVSLQGLPTEFEELGPEILAQVEIPIDIDGVSSERSYDIDLTYENGFQGELIIVPGSYQVNYSFVGGNSLSLLEIESERYEISLATGEEKEIVVQVLNAGDLVQSIKSLVPQKEIEQADKFSRLMQIDGQLVSMNDLVHTAIFDDNGSRIDAKEVASVESSYGKGIYLLYQNQSNQYAEVYESTFIGVRVNRNRVVFPGGLSLGMDISQVAHASEGIYGEMSYATGSPYVGLGIEGTEVYFLDAVSGDRIELYMNSSHTYISQIEYRFAQYE